MYHIDYICSLDFVRYECTLLDKSIGKSAKGTGKCEDQGHFVNMN